MRVVVTLRAAKQVEAIYEYIALDNPNAAHQIAERIYERVERMAAVGFGEMGRLGRRSGTRELTVPPYVIVYRLERSRDEIIVLSVVHGARRA